MQTNHETREAGPLAIGHALAVSYDPSQPWPGLPDRAYEMTTWSLIKIVHDEVLASVAGHPNAHTFSRTSFCLAPESWRALEESELEIRLETLIEAGYAKRNYALKGCDDTTPMQMIGWDFEWVPDSEMSTRPWTAAFHGFRIREDGREWHIVNHREVGDLFDKHLLGAAQ